MIEVRDRLKHRNEYKGRPTLAVDEYCPCRVCYNPHDCGHRSSDGEWIQSMHCAKNFNDGCPSTFPVPTHIVRNLNLVMKGIRKCLRCARMIDLQRDDWVLKTNNGG